MQGSWQLMYQEVKLRGGKGVDRKRVTLFEQRTLAAYGDLVAPHYLAFGKLLSIKLSLQLESHLYCLND